MPENKPVEKSNQSAATFGERAKKGGVYALFGFIWLTPRLRRLRRRFWAWTLVRIGLTAGGAWLVWHLKAGWASVSFGILLIVLGFLVRATPVKKSVDEFARELGALIVLNGGTFTASTSTKATRGAQIFVQADGLTICDLRHRQVMTLPQAKFRSLAAHPVPNRTRKGHQTWEVEIVWEAEGPQTARFRYEGPFAEHLAQVAESTLRSRWKKELPILQ